MAARPQDAMAPISSRLDTVISHPLYYLRRDITASKERQNANHCFEPPAMGRQLGSLDKLSFVLVGNGSRAVRRRSRRPQQTPTGQKEKFGALKSSPVTGRSQLAS